MELKSAFRRRLAGLVVAGILIGGLAPAAVPANEALAATKTALPDGFDAIVVDDASGHVFVSSPDSSVVTVLDLAGKIVRKIENLPGAAGMALVDGTLFVALSKGGAIDAIDTGTLARTRRIAEGRLVEPRSLVFAGGRLWTTSGRHDEEKKLVAVDAVTGETTEYDNPIPIGTLLVGSPADPDLLLGWDNVLNVNTAFVRWDLTTNPPTVAAARRADEILNTMGVAFAPDGQTILVASGISSFVQTLQTSDLQPAGISYKSAPYPNAPATTSARNGLVAAGSTSLYWPDIKVYAEGEPSKPLFTWDFEYGGGTLFPKGLAFSPDGSAVYAVAGSSDLYGEPYYGHGPAHLHVLRIDRFAQLGAGWNGFGQLGIGAGTQARSAGKIPVAGRTTDVAAGLLHSAAVKEDGSALTWGWNGFGQLGDGTTSDRFPPVRVTGIGDVRGMAAGYFHTVAVKHDGTVWAWGWNGFGQIGDGTVRDRRVPVRVPGLTDVVAVSAGGFHTMALREDGSVWAWGWNGFGQLGDGSTADRLLPRQVHGLPSIASISAGGYHSLAAGTDGNAYGWGWNAFGQLGDGSKTDRQSPTPVLDVTDVRIVSAGFAHSHAIKEEPYSRHQMYSWGWNAFGQLGSGGYNDIDRPEKTFYGESPDDVSAGMLHSVAVSHGKVSGWGWNAFGQLGAVQGTVLHNYAPVSGTIGASAAAAGGYHTVAAIADP